MKEPGNLHSVKLLPVSLACDIFSSRAASVLKKQLNIDSRRLWIMLAVKGEGLSQRELCELLHVNPNVMVRIVDTLERSKHVTRVKQEKNRSKHFVELTDRGRAIIVKWENAKDKLLHEVFYPLEMNEIDTLKALCDKVVLAEKEECE